MEKWSYKIPAPQQMWNTQKDWNQSLMVKFNMLSNGKHEKTLIMVPNKFKSLIESLHLYDNSTIDSKYIVEFIDVDSNIINVGDKKIEVENFEKNYSADDENIKSKIFGVEIMWDYEGGGVVAVFSTFEKAEEYANTYKLSCGQSIEVVSMIIDEPDKFESVGCYRHGGS